MSLLSDGSYLCSIVSLEEERVVPAASWLQRHLKKCLLCCVGCKYTKAKNENRNLMY